MRRVLIDTNIYTAFKRNHSAIIESFKRLDFIGIDVTVLAELYSGFKGGNKETINAKELEGFLNTSRVHILNHNEITAEFYANIFNVLKNKGKPIPTSDIWIAASSMQNGLALFTLDIQHFREIEGLVLKTDY
ncbi:MAG: PIN domain-containing protein [Spirochaeta sp.]|nr:PIN domain-containing protein [Spirochaeta sp.]